jgi:hypothetical protein
MMISTTYFSAGTTLVFFLLMIVYNLCSRFIEVIGIGAQTANLISYIKDQSDKNGISFVRFEEYQVGEGKSPIYYNLYNPLPEEPTPEVIFLVTSSYPSDQEHKRIESIKQQYQNRKTPLFIGIISNIDTLPQKVLKSLENIFDVFLVTRLLATSDKIKEDATTLISAFYDLAEPGWAGIDFYDVKKGLKNKGQGVLVYKDITADQLPEDLTFLPFKRSAFEVPKSGLARIIYLNIPCNNGSTKLWNLLNRYLFKVDETTEVLINLPLKSTDGACQTNYPCTMLLTGYT